MRIGTASLYCEPGYTFEIPYKIDLLIRNRLNEMVTQKYLFDMIQTDVLLSFIVSTSSKTEKVEAKGPDVNKRQRTVTWGLWLPYKEITKANNPIKEYIRCFFEAAGMILEGFKVKKEDVQNVRKEVEEELRKNPDLYH